jgi:hypothetical protein
MNADYAEKSFPTLKNPLTTKAKMLVVKGRVDAVAVDGMKRCFSLK